MELYHTRIKRGDAKLKDGVENILKFFNQREITCMVTSSSRIVVIEEMMAHSNISKYFTKYIGADHVKNAKPAPDIYLKAWKESNVHKEDLIVYEDSTAGVRAANDAGVDVIMVPDLIEPGNYEKEMALDIVNRIDESIKWYV